MVLLKYMGVNKYGEDADVSEANHTAKEEDPLLCGWSLSSNSSESNHENVNTNCQQDFVTLSTCQSKAIPEHEWSGKNPVNVSSIEELVDSVGRVDVVAQFLDVGFSGTREHGHVKNGCNSGDEHGQDFEFTVARFSLHCHHVKVHCGDS